MASKVFARIGSFSLVLTCLGCCHERTILDVEASRIAINIRKSPQTLLDIMQVKGCKIDAQYCENNRELDETIIVTGVGTISWPQVNVHIRKGDVIINEKIVIPRNGAYRNVLIEDDGEVLLDCFLPFEAHRF